MQLRIAECGLRNGKAGALMRGSAFLAVMLAVVFSGCAAGGKSGALYFGKEKNATEQVVAAGDIFRIELPSNPTTGYDWYVVSLDQRYFHVMKTGYTPDAPQLTGSGGRKWWEIKALNPGRSTLSMSYYRVWEGPDKAVEKYEVKFIIKNES